MSNDNNQSAQSPVYVQHDAEHIMYECGREEWSLNGKRHRVGGPAIIDVNGTEIWYQNGEIHREDGPAYTDNDGTQEWYQNGVLHRKDGPAMTLGANNEVWYLHGKLHRMDGPAVIDADGTQRWCLFGDDIPFAVFQRFQDNLLRYAEAAIFPVEVLKLMLEEAYRA